MPLTRHHDVSLKALNTFGVEARARELLVLDAIEDLDAALAQLAGRAPLVLGGGSNLLIVRDLTEPVLQIRTRGITRLDSDADTVLVEAAAGESWDGLVRHTLQAGWFGLENLTLIPGLVGAAPIQNIGAYGLEMRERCEGVLAVNLRDGERRWFGNADCAFDYRQSFFKTAAGQRWLVLAVRFRLLRHPQPRLSYAELARHLQASGIDQPDPLQVSAAVAEIRRRKLPDPATLGNAGSFFKNPVVPAAVAQRLKARHAELPVFAAGVGTMKLAAAWMIDQCGWKGYRRGDAGVHARHALVLVNHGNATGAQLLALAHDIRESVLQHFGVELEAEPVILD